MLRFLSLSRASSSIFRPAATRCFAAYPSHELVGLPALSPTMTHGTLSSWKLKEGDAISPGDIICEVETDKAVVDYEAQDDGFLARILVSEGTQDIPVGSPMMITVEEQEDIAAFADYQVPEEAVQVQPKSADETPPTKDQVSVDNQTGQPVAPLDFLISSQTTPKAVETPKKADPVVPSDFLVSPQTPMKEVSGPPIPAGVSVAKMGTSTPSASTKIAYGLQSSALSKSLSLKHKKYLELYGITGTIPIGNTE